MVFELCICHRYKTEKRFYKFVETCKTKGLLKDPAVKLQIRKLSEQVDLERSDNESEASRNYGRKLRFGDAVQLRHVFTRKYLHVDSKSMSPLEKSNMKVITAF